MQHNAKDPSGGPRRTAVIPTSSCLLFADSSGNAATQIGTVVNEAHVTTHNMHQLM